MFSKILLNRKQIKMLGKIKNISNLIKIHVSKLVERI